MFRRVGLLAALAAAACCSKSEVKGGGAAGSGQRLGPSFSLFALAEMRGQIGPCGCTSDPLGDLSRTAELIEIARAAGPVLVVDAGSLLYSKSPVPAHLDAQEELKADLLVRTYKEELGVAAVGLGPMDLAKGADKLRIPRHVVNLAGAKTGDAAKPGAPDGAPANAKPVEGAKPEGAKPVEGAKPEGAKPVEGAKPDDAKPGDAKPRDAKPVRTLPAEGGKPADANPEGVAAGAPAVAINAADIAVEPPKVVEVGGTKVGIFGVITADAVPGLAVTDPVAAGKTASKRLRDQGAQVVVALIQATSKRDAVKLMREIGGVDVGIAGLGALAPEPDRVEVEPTKVGDGWLIVPANRGQVLARVDVTVRGAGPLVDAVGPSAATSKAATIEKQIAALDADLVKFKSDKDADPAFVARTQAERDQLQKDLMTLKASPTLVPANGSYLTLDQIRVNKKLACDAEVQTGVTAYNRAAGDANVKAAAAKPVVALPKGMAGFVGTEACSDCHSDAVDFWKTTRHAHAWETIEKRGQQFDFDCIGCHVTGWDQPGGSTLVNNETLRDVQCETCHGPGSIHVAKGGEERPSTMKRMPPENLCATQCHTKEHSDTFELTPYLRDVTGPGHGEDLRKQLGDGPTGQQLRKAALDKAGRDLGAGCVR